MKLLKTLTAIAVVGLATTLAYADDTNAPAKPEGKHGPRGGPGPMMEHLLPPRVVDDLNLTADQKTKLGELESAFKKDAVAWDTAHPTFRDDMRKARESGDKDAIRSTMEQRKPLMDARKGYVEKFRASLTDEQKTKLDKSLEDVRQRMGKGPRGDKHDGPPPPPPAN